MREQKKNRKILINLRSKTCFEQVGQVSSGVVDFLIVVEMFSPILT